MKKFLFIMLIIIIGLSLLGYYFYNAWSKPVGIGNNKAIIMIYKGEGISSISKKLEDADMIHSSFFFKNYCKIKKIIPKIKYGKYDINDGLDVDGIIKKITTTGIIEEFSITFIEGWNIYDIAEEMERNGIAAKEEVIDLCYSKNLLKKLKLNQNTPEGYLLPETYRFRSGTSPDTILIKMKKEFDNNFDPTKLTTKLDNISLNFHEMLTLASIIEKETGNKSERDLVASLYWSRLKHHKMKMECDPSVIYALILNGKWTGKIHTSIKKRINGRIDWSEVDSPYNTYLYKGLPPTPICNPSKETITATLNAEYTEYKYFVAKGDGSGEHRFGENYTEHLNNIKLYKDELKTYRSK